jgi:hypothetical protein
MESNHYPISKLILIANEVYLNGVLIKSKYENIHPYITNKFLLEVMSDYTQIRDYALNIETYELELYT